MTNIRSFLGAAGVAAVAALGMSTAALADEDKFGYSITISGASDYVFRGLTFNSNDPAFQPFIEFTYGNPNLTWYLDFWGSNISGEGFEPFEMDIYAGVRPVTGPVSWDLGVLYYTYPDNSLGWGATDYVEFKIAATITPITNLTATALAFYTPDQANYGETYTLEGDLGYALPEFHGFTPTISGAIGYTDGTGGFSACACGTDGYVYWNAGLKLSIDKYFMDFRYWDTNISDADGGRDVDSNKFIFTAGVNLP
ncbi:MAG: TorF family putative porin [Hyphomicrobium sp.]|uniref:TorF family putative porin n=1 Tax=Hyphomicrobium sp. TaxID=82 RepID=UPI0039E3E9A7